MNREPCRAALYGGRGDGIDWLDHHRWPGLQAIGKVAHLRQIGGQVSTEIAYDLLSSALSPERLNEDKDCTCLGNRPNTITVLRHMALNVMQQEGSKGSLRRTFNRAGWNEAHLSSLPAQA